MSQDCKTPCICNTCLGARDKELVVVRKELYEQAVATERQRILRELPEEMRKPTGIFDNERGHGFVSAWNEALAEVRKIVGV